MKRRAVASSPIANGNWPPATSTSAGPALRYGTCTISSPASRASSAIARCCALPLPAEAKLKRPGKARASSMKARASRTPLAGPTSSTIGSRTSCVTGVKSRDGL